MKRLLQAALILFLLSLPAFSSTFYVRPDGGSRYTAANPTGQCNGKTDAAYPGSGVNQPCGFNDIRWLWDDQSYGNYPNWAIAGGDTVILRANGTSPWRVGFQGNGVSTDPWCLGGSGPYGCVMPPIPSGTSTNHTKFLGENYAACAASRTFTAVTGTYTQPMPNPAKTTKISGGHGAYTVVNVAGSQYVDVQCLDISSFNPACQLQGSPQPNPCSRNPPLDDYVSDGFSMSNASGNLTIQDIYIHGTNSRGMHGQQGTGPVSMNRIWISVTPQTGLDFDDGTASGTAAFSLTNSVIEWSGCQQKTVQPYYAPVSDAQTAADITYCYSQSSGGVIGDGIGTPPNSGFNVTMDHDVFQWNTQDGEDFGHMDTGHFSFTLTNSLSLHNLGQTFKDGWAFNNIVWENNLSVADCLRMLNPIAGADPTVNQYLSDGCRAGDDYSINFQNGAMMTMANNTLVTYAPTTIDYKCVSGNTPNNCPSASWTFENNIILGYTNPTVGVIPADFCGNSCNTGDGAKIGTITRKNNIYFNLRYCDANLQTPDSISWSSTGELCVTPQLSSQPSSFSAYNVLDNFNFNLTSTSPARNAGVVVSGLTTDFATNTYGTPPSMGGLEFGSIPPPVLPPLKFTGILKFSGTTSAH